MFAGENIRDLCIFRLRCPGRKSFFSLEFLLAVLCLAISLVFRLTGVVESTLQPDELHWVNRSHRILYQLEQHRNTNLTSHLPHPGIVPSLIMLAGQFFVDNNEMASEPDGNSYHLDRLTASRLAIALVSSFLPLIIYFAGKRIIGLIPAFLAACLFALDPHNIALSQIAHLDSIMTLLVFSVISVFYFAERNNSLKLKFTAAFLWGLSLCTKATAFFILPALFAYRLLYYSSLPNEERRQRAILGWSDLYCLLFGHAVFSALYTRLWHHPSYYSTKFRMHSKVADEVYLFGSFMREHWLISIILFGFLIALGGYWVLRTKSAVTEGRTFHAGMLSLTAALLGFLFLLVPQVLESLVYYYYLVLGFAHARHSGYGYQWEPPPYGYPGLFFSKIPSLALAGFAVCFLTLGKAEQWKGEYRERSFFVLLVTFSVLSWVGLLSVADKQAWRYAMPVLPGVYLVAAIGIDGLSRQFYCLSQYVARFLGARHGSSSVGGISALLLTVIIGTQLGITSSWYPDYYLFRNSISGGLSAAVERNEVVPTCGLKPLYSFLDSNKVGRRQTYVTVCGDIDLVRYSYERHYPGNPGRIEFTPFEGVYGGDYLLVFSAFREKCKPMIKEEDLPRLEEVFSYSRDNVQLSTIYKVTQPDLKDLFTYGIRGAFHQTGFRGHHEVLGDIISAAPHRSIPGYLSFGQHLLLGAGSYEVLFPLLIPASTKGRFDENKVVLRLEVGAEEKYVQFNEINPGEVSFVKMGFVREAERRVQLRTYWFGAVPVSIGSPSIIKRNSPSNDVSSAK